MAQRNSWADIRNSDIALVRRARGVPADNLNTTSQFMNLSPEDVQYIARLRGRTYDPRFSPIANLRGDDIDFIRNMGNTSGVTEPQRFVNSGSPYVGGPAIGQPAAPVLDAIPPVRNEGILNRLEAARRAKEYPGLNRGLDPSLPGNDPTAGPIGTVNYDPVLGAPGMPRLSPPMRQSDIDAYNESNRPRVEEGILQRVARKMTGGPTPAPAQPSTPSPYLSTDDRLYNVPGVSNGTPLAPAVDQGSPFVGGPIPFTPDATGGGAMADARAQEIAYANSMMPQAGSMEAARAQEIAFANSQPNPAARRGSGSAQGIPMPPVRPEGLGGATPALYMVDFGDGSPVKSFLSQDGVAPNIPGANVFKDDSYNPNAGALTKLIRGVF